MSAMALVRCIGSCVPAFLAAIAVDVVGLVLLFVGIFANLRLDGRFYGDFLIYTGALVIFASLGCWLVWYLGNLQVSDDYEGPDDANSVVEKLARTISRRMSQKPRHAKCFEDADSGSQVGPVPAHRAGKVTWGRNSAYHNEGYDDSLDSPTWEGERQHKGEEEEDEGEEEEGQLQPAE